MTIERWKWVAIGILGISVFSLMALTTEQKDEMVRLREISTQDNNEVASLNEFVRKLAPNLFDSLKNKPGDIIAGMTVLSIEPDLSGPLTNDNVYAKFSGTTTISGEYDFGQDEVNGGDFLTFQVTDPKERIKIPMMAESLLNDFLPYFDLTESKAGNSFGPKYGRGHATIEITNYQLFSAPTEARDSAELIRVISKTPEK